MEGVEVTPELIKELQKFEEKKTTYMVGIFVAGDEI